MAGNINQGKWYSKKSIVRDLARATGIRHIDDTCFVVGEIPPPRRGCIEDESEMMYRYGDLPEHIPNEVQVPDLNGIREMLRMVDNETVDRPKPDNNNIGDPPCNDSILTISKLNPDVAEFLPANTTHSACVKENGSGDNKKEISITRDSKSSRMCNNKVEIEKGSGDGVKEYKTNEHLVLPANDIKKMKEKLITKISYNSNTNCVKGKREKNLAIASLLKLCSQAPEGNSNVTKYLTTHSLDQHIEPTKRDTFKLLPPDYYETRNKSIEVANEVPNPNENASAQSEGIQDEERSSTNFNSINIASNAANVNGKVSMTNVQSIDDADIQISVKKVENWLAGMTSRKVDDDSPEKPTAEEDQTTTSKINPSTPNKPKKNLKTSGPPSLFLGPVTFKRKGVVKSNSTSVTSESTARKTPSTSYVPSAYASELSRSYNERAKSKKAFEDHIYTRLYAELDKRDEAYRTQVAEAAAVSSSISDLDHEVPTQ